jgi:hypothetical protein
VFSKLLFVCCGFLRGFVSACDMTRSCFRED